MKTYLILEVGGGGSESLNHHVVSAFLVPLAFGQQLCQKANSAAHPQSQGQTQVEWGGKGWILSAGVMTR